MNDQSNPPEFGGAPDGDSPARARIEAPNRLDDGATRLLETLPPTVRLTNLRGLYPRILNRIAEVWNDAVAFDALIDSLLITDRSNRMGFPFAVVRELSELREYYMEVNGIPGFDPANPFSR